MEKDREDFIESGYGYQSSSEADLSSHHEHHDDRHHDDDHEQNTCCEKVKKILQLIQNEIYEIGDKLDKPCDELEELKECIKHIECILTNPTFGLGEIKSEVAAIEEMLTNSHHGLHEIKEEVASIEQKLDNPNHGLVEIKREIAAIEEMLTNSHHGLHEIKEEVASIEQKLDNPNHGLVEIKREVAAIEEKLDNPNHGLVEIKEEIKEILGILGKPASTTLTTGPVVADNASNSIVIKVYNNTSALKTVTVNVYNIGDCKHEIFATQTFRNLNSKCSADVIFKKPPTDYEVEFVGMVPGVYGWTATRTNGSDKNLNESNFNAANTFRHSELIPKVGS